MYRALKTNSEITESRYLSNFKYKLLSVIGTGGFSQVYKARDTTFNNYVAIKKIDLAKKEIQGHDPYKVLTRMRQIFKKEAQIMQNLNHINIIKLLDFYMDEEDIYLILEYASGGELFHIIYTKGNLSEYETTFIIQQLIQAVDYLHSKGIVHRDIKLENLLLVSTDIRSTLKLCDFGISRRLKNNMTTLCGTIAYSAPELLKNSPKGYNYTIDNWSIGVITYILLCGYTPFYSECGDQNEVKQQIFQCKYKFHSPKWYGVSNDAKRFISSFLQLDPTNRMTLKEGLKNQWILSNVGYKPTNAL